MINLLNNKIFNNVFLFDSSMDMKYIENFIDNIGNKQRYDEFSLNRYTFLFKPGTYNIDITLEYYMQAVGLGKSPYDVVIIGSVQSITTTKNSNVTTMFWRSAENFTVKPRDKNEPIVWAVSQAAPYRRMNIKGDLVFDQNGWASGGYLGNSLVEGVAGTRSGQQWFTINSELGSWFGGQWNRFFIGTKGAMEENWPKEPITNVDNTEVLREKPFLTINGDGSFSLFRPSIKENSIGVSWKENNEPGNLIPLDKFYITDVNTDTSFTINKALERGKHLLITPGIYKLDEPIIINRENTVVYGMGMATLIPVYGKSVIEVKDIQGVSISGLIIDAGEVESKSLIRIGENKLSTNNFSDNPITIHDLICRVGGMLPGRAETCLEVNSNYVILDHLWLWRADHGNGVGWSDNRCSTGVIINGDHVKAYGLFVEHFQKYQTLWLGEYGKTFFYQSELPYDPPNQNSWSTKNRLGYASYKVGDHVHNHEAYGLGIYAFMGIKDNTDKNVHIDCAVETPERPGINIHHITCFSKGYGTIYNCLNSRGGSVQPGCCYYY
ncbi:adenylyl cyclase [Thiospirochaeta perfilievii]|uniref:Adenylyl cyclase n=1 Tax=Thiospirochaeta perfilievii TaxID=252967 RepID=A0A5C1Q8C0_9SPIO|nr:adenylyl cyclase [Thiospirochaeta perfilievii]QEN03667.1 adenylyl cyclase [Thiospirochaeta perfilievii]